MKKLKLQLFFLCLSICSSSLAQKTSLFKSFDLGVDYLKLATFAFSKETKYEGIAALNFGFGLSIDGEYGYGKKTPAHMIKNGSYTFEGTYYRIGLGYNTPLSETTTLGIGARYAQSSFEDRTAYIIKSVVFSDYKEELSRSDLSAQWLELVLRSEAGLKKIKNMKLGMFMRVKFLDPVNSDSDNSEMYKIRGIPGYGQANNNRTFAINFFIKYSIPLSKSN